GCYERLVRAIGGTGHCAGPFLFGQGCLLLGVKRTSARHCEMSDYFGALSYSMRYWFTLLFVLAIGMSAHGQSRSDKTGGVRAAPTTSGAPLNITPGAAPPVPKKITQLITAADKKLLAECGEVGARAYLRTPT